MKHLKSIDSFSEPISEARVTVKRRYTESHPAKNISTAARVRNSVIEAMGDGVLTEEELSKILQELKAHKRWLGRNTKLFNISEDQNGIKSYALSPFGKRVMKKTITVNESNDINEMDTYAKDILDNYKKDIYAMIKKINKNAFSGEDGALVADSLAMVLTDIAKNEMKHDKFINEASSQKGKDLSKKELRDLLNKAEDMYHNTNWKREEISKLFNSLNKQDREKLAIDSNVPILIDILRNESVNEASRWKGKDLYPDWIKPGDINPMPVKNINDLTVGLTYVIRDYGDNAYHGDYELKEVGRNYVFVDSAMHSQGGEMIFTKKEMLDVVKSSDIYEQD